MQSKRPHEQQLDIIEKPVETPTPAPSSTNAPTSTGRPDAGGRRRGTVAAPSEGDAPQWFIGVVYLPGSERLSHCQDAAPSRQFDAYAWFDKTTAVTPLGPKPHTPADTAEAYPFGV